MDKESAVCFNCKFWEIEPGALDQKHRSIARKLTSSENIPSGMYGKCRATFRAQNGEEHYYDMGTLAPTPCVARNDKGNILFEPIPVG
ncbi:hypothetical protein HYT60_01430 [Candidatus Woesebacteria bacterium]|nr:hypothetical protein [Candidatus Woesebacteria bacterium]